MSQEIEIGLGKKGRLGYALDDVAIVPSRRTRDPEDVSTSWQIDAYEFDVPVIGAPMDSVTSPATAIAMGKMGALGVLDLEGLWTRYEDPTPLLDEIAGLPADQATERIQQIYAEPVKPELITQRLHEIRAAGVTVAGALSPQRTQQFYSTVVDAGVDLFVIRGTVVSAEHVSSGQEPLNLKKFIYDLDVPVIVGGASNYTAALHLMRTGAAAEADEHAGRAGTHQVQGRGVVGGAAYDDGHIQIVDELLQVQWLVILGDVLGGNDRAADDEQVDARFEHGRIIVLRALRGQGARNGDAGVTNLMQTLDNELRLDRLGVDLLNTLGRAFGRQFGDLVKQRLRIVVAGPQAFEVEHAKRAHLAHGDGGGRLVTESIGAPITGTSNS